MDLDTIEVLVGMLIPLAVCVGPVVLAVAAVAVLVVIFGRKKPKAAPKKAAARKAAAAPKATRVATRKAKKAPQPKPVKLEDLATKSCPSCGADNPSDNAFCEYCGESLAEE